MVRLILKKVIKGSTVIFAPGIENGATLELEIDFSRIPSETPTDFFEFIQFPNFNSLNQTSQIATNNANSNKLAAFKFEKKYVGNGDDANWHVKLRGVLLQSPKYTYKDEKFTAAITLIHWTKKALENVDYGLGWGSGVVKNARTRTSTEPPAPPIPINQPEFSLYENYFYWEMVHRDNGKEYRTEQGHLSSVKYDESIFKFLKLPQLKVVYSANLSYYAKKIFRDPNKIIEIKLPIPVFYTQKDDGDGALGSKLSDNYDISIYTFYGKYIKRHI